MPMKSRPLPPRESWLHRSATPCIHATCYFLLLLYGHELVLSHYGKDINGIREYGTAEEIWAQGVRVRTTEKKKHEELNDLYCSQNIPGVIRSWYLTLMDHVA
jgi:hypothetical protein